MYTIQLVSKIGDKEVISWWCELDKHKIGFGAERFCKLFVTEAEAQKKLDYCRIWAWRYHRNTAIKVSVKPRLLQGEASAF